MRSPLRLQWRVARTTTLVMTSVVLLVVEIGLRAYNASGGARGMAPIAPLLLNPAVAALEGRISSLTTAGAFIVWKMATFILLGCASWGALTATRLTRLSEDEGSWDQLVLGGPSRGRVLLDTIVVLAQTGLLVGGLVWALLVGSGQAVAPSAMFALDIIAALWMGVAIGLVSAQVVAPRRSASQVAMSTVMIFSLIRIVADGATSTEWWRAFTFFGWIEDAGAFDRPHWLALLPSLGVPVLLVGAAYLLQRRRDVGRALWHHNDEHRASTLLLRTSWTFALRERRTNWQVWMAGFVILSFTIGYLTHALIVLAHTDRRFVALLNHWGLHAMVRGVGFITQASVDFSFTFAIFAAAWVTQIATDELRGRLDMPFAMGIRRAVWLAGVLATVVVAVVVTDVICALIMWLGIVVSGSSLALSMVLQSMLSVLGVMPFVIGLSVALIAFLPRGSFATLTAGLSCLFIVTALGPVLHWPAWLLALSPFHYLRAVPLQSPDWVGLAWLTTIGVLGGAVGAVHFCRRDLA